MIIDPARAMHHYPTMEDNLLVCNNYIDTSYMIAFTYPIILIIVCTIYAILTRKIPEAFNESKHIGKFTFSSRYPFLITLHIIHHITLLIHTMLRAIIS